MATARKKPIRSPLKRRAKSGKMPTSPVVTVRLSDLEKERLDEIMRTLDIKRYSDVMRMALQMVHPQQLSG